jgi:hypothetical protein
LIAAHSPLQKTGTEWQRGRNAKIQTMPPLQKSPAKKPISICKHKTRQMLLLRYKSWLMTLCSGLSHGEVFVIPRHRTWR